MDTKCTNVTQAHRAGGGRGIPLLHAVEEESTAGTSCHSQYREGIASAVESLGDGLQQGEFLSGNTYSSRATTERVVEAIVASDEAQSLNSAWLGLGFDVRCGSRILREMQVSALSFGFKAPKN